MVFMTAVVVRRRKTDSTLRLCTVHVYTATVVYLALQTRSEFFLPPPPGRAKNLEGVGGAAPLHPQLRRRKNSRLVVDEKFLLCSDLSTEPDNGLSLKSGSPTDFSSECPREVRVGRSVHPGAGAVFCVRLRTGSDG